MKKFEVNISPKNFKITGSANIVSRDNELSGVTLFRGKTTFSYSVALDLSKDEKLVINAESDQPLFGRLIIVNDMGVTQFESPISIYGNDWNGIDNSGDLLPNGSYFFTYIFEGVNSKPSIPWQPFRIYRSETNTNYAFDFSEKSAVIFSFRTMGKLVSILKDGRWRCNYLIEDQNGNSVLMNSDDNIIDSGKIGTMYSNFIEIDRGVLSVGVYNITVGLQWIDANNNPTNISFFKELDQKIEVTDNP